MQKYKTHAGKKGRGLKYRRRFNGAIFSLMSGVYTKNEAYGKARELRRKGYFVRTVKVRLGEYRLYSRI